MTIKIVDGQSIIIVAPMLLPSETIQKILADKGRWIEKKLAERSAVNKEHSQILSKSKLLIFGVESSIVFGDVPNTCFVDDRVILPESKKEDTEAISKELSKFIMSIAKNTLPKLVAFWGTKMSLCPTSIKIKSLKSKWGSCNGDGEIVLNSKLIHIPRALAEYVVVHELCHLKNLNHSDAFWTSVAYYLPDYAEKRKELKQYDYLTVM